MSEHDEIIAEAREKYTVHNCDQCEFRKSCNLGKNGFDSDECRRRRQSIMLGFGIEDGYFTKLLDRLEAAHKSDIEDAIAATVKVAAESASKVYELHIQSKPVGNAAKIREALETISKCDISKEEDCYTLYSVCEAALSAPPRNCDLYLTPKDAMLAHLAEVYEGEKVEFGDYEWCEFVKWLFAEAKGEAKGEAK